jgi:hypothetical protein
MDEIANLAPDPAGKVVTAPPIRAASAWAATTPE